MNKTPTPKAITQRLEEIEKRYPLICGCTTDKLGRCAMHGSLKEDLKATESGTRTEYSDIAFLLALAKEVPQLLEALEEIAGKAEGINRVMECTGVAQQALSHYNSTISPLLK